MKYNAHNPRPLPTRERLCELFRYEDGRLIYISKATPSSRVKIGSEAGTINKGHGYRTVWVDGHSYTAQRVIWKMKKGIDPVGVIDHINYNKLDNRIENLRDIPHGDNISHSCTKHGFRGADYHRKTGKWLGRFRRDKKVYCCGYYKTAIEASFASDIGRSLLDNGLEFNNQIIKEAVKSTSIQRAAELLSRSNVI